MNKDESKIIKLLQGLGASLTPPKNSLEKLLQNIDNEDVTKEQLPRYIYSMNWKFAVPLALIALAIAGLFVYRSLPTKVAQLPSAQNFEIPQKVTAQNSDSVLSQTDQELNQNMDQLDQDLKDVDAAQNQEEDVNSI